MQGRVITISRQCGSGGHSIGNELAKRLNVPFYDKEIIEMTAKESGFHPQFVEEKGSCVIVGRCADYILRDRKDVLNVFIHADMEFKKKHCMERRQFPEGNAEDMIRRRDTLRADHYRYYTDQKWGDSFHYHLCLDSSMFGIEKCVDIIEDACKAMRPVS